MDARTFRWTGEDAGGADEAHALDSNGRSLGFDARVAEVWATARETRWRLVGREEHGRCRTMDEGRAAATEALQALGWTLYREAQAPGSERYPGAFVLVHVAGPSTAYVGRTEEQARRIGREPIAEPCDCDPCELSDEEHAEERAEALRRLDGAPSFVVVASSEEHAIGLLRAMTGETVAATVATWRRGFPHDGAGVDPLQALADEERRAFEAAERLRAEREERRRRQDVRIEERAEAERAAWATPKLRAGAYAELIADHCDRGLLDAGDVVAAVVGEMAPRVAVAGRLVGLDRDKLAARLAVDVLEMGEARLRAVAAVLGAATSTSTGEAEALGAQ